MNDISKISDETEIDDFGDIVLNWLRLSMSENEERHQVVEFLSAVAVTSKTDLLKEFVDIMVDYNPNEENLPYMTILLTHEVTEDILDIIVQIFDPEYYSMVRGLMEINNPDYLQIGINNIKYIYRESPLNKFTVETLLDKARQLSVPLLEIYLSDIMYELNKEYAAVPSWIIPHPQGLLTHKQLIKSLIKYTKPRQDWTWNSVSIEHDAEYLCSISPEDYNMDDLYNQLVNVLKNKTVTEREEFITKINTQNGLMLLSIEDEIFKVLGGCLAPGEAYELKLLSRDPCSMYGGCRAYTCYENENINPSVEEPIIINPVGRNLLDELEWFGGRCDKCKLLIRKKHYAVRMPVENGGWLGCYCSFECLKENVNPEHETRVNLVNAFEQMYNGVGIYERLD